MLVTASLILVITYIGIAFAWLPKVNIDRASAAFTGALLMVVLGVLTFSQAISAINFQVITLLLGMMLLSASLQSVGFFNLLAIKAVTLAATPRRLLWLITLATALASAFFVNDAVVLLFTPIVIQTCRHRRINPIPYLIAEAMASNIGSAATIVGNPQNMLIGITANISFTRFLLYLLPIAAVSTIALGLIIEGFFYRELHKPFAETTDDMPAYDRKGIIRLLPVISLVTIGFFINGRIGVEISVVAIIGAAIALIVGREKPTTVIRSIDWVLLLFFAGLFIVIQGAHEAGVLDVFVRNIRLTPDFNGIVSISVVSTIVSQIVSNVPLTMLVIPLIKNVPGDTLWIALAAGSTLGGNLTIIGAVANIIVVESAAREKVAVNFWQFAKVGLVVTIVTVGFAILILGLESWFGWLR